MDKLNTINHFIGESEFDSLYISKCLDQVEINRERLINDALDVRNKINSKGAKELLYKINSAKISGNFKKSTEYSIIEKIIEGDEIYQERFMIKPKRQNGKKAGNEFIQTNYIQNKLNYFDNVKILTLNNNGPQSERISNGKVIQNISKGENTTKSMDCKILNDNNFRIRTINKITTSLIKETNDSGGSQSNQLELSEKDIDSIDFNNTENQDLYIIFILDGKFYKNNSYVFGLIRKYENNKHVYLTTSDGIKEVIGSILYS